jgi:RNA polymerase sigma-70 factor (sigma-E family)
MTTTETTTDDAFTAAVQNLHRPLARFAYLICGDAARAEDLVADAYARVWPRWRAGRVDDLGAYLRRTIVNQSNQHWRRSVLERREERRLRVDWRDGLSPERAADDRSVVVAALQQLPDDQRLAIVLRIWEDLSEAKTAEFLGVPAGTVKSRVSRGLARLREEMEGVLDG